MSDLSAVPNFPAVEASSNTDIAIKVASKDIMLADESIPVDLMTNLVFEAIGGQELINISRNDIVNGQNVVYQPISNISLIALQYNSQNLIAMPDTAGTIFNNYSIKLESKIPTTTEPVTIDASGNIVVSAMDIKPGEQIEIQVLSSGTVFDDTIY